MTSIARSMLAVGVLVGGSLIAAGAQAEGFYAGGSIGSAHLHNDVGGYSADNGTAYKLYGGATINPYFGVEAGYADLGHFGGDGGRLRARGIFADAVGNYPLGHDISLLGRLGVFTGRLAQENSAVATTLPSTYNSGSGTSLKLGAGLQYDLTKAVSLRGEWEQYHFNAIDEKPKANLFSVGVNYRF